MKLWLFTSESAFFYLGLTDAIPNKYFLATPNNVSKIKNEQVEQIFMANHFFKIGKSQINYNNVQINIYNKERMLIELIRNKNTIYRNNITVKGGVVMFNITNDKRRATVDIDLIRYSLEDKSILILFDKLNQIDYGITIIVNKKIKPLKHQDYHGKRVLIVLNTILDFIKQLEPLVV